MLVTELKFYKKDENSVMKVDGTCFGKLSENASEVSVAFSEEPCL